MPYVDIEIRWLGHCCLNGSNMFTGCGAGGVDEGNVINQAQMRRQLAISPAVQIISNEPKSQRTQALNHRPMAGVDVIFAPTPSPPWITPSPPCITPAVAACVEP